ncbi:hypothetical protein [Phaeospirillum tilakii]|uniref:DUF4350 domain-containing protein n=1 Tax=Phaeospirillum tilakii TaxID=741673 RepID=A0ABW5CAD2_9PROT
MKDGNLVETAFCSQRSTDVPPEFIIDLSPTPVRPKRAWGLIAPLLVLLGGGLLWGGEWVLSPRPGQPLAVIFPTTAAPDEIMAPWEAGATQVMAFGLLPGLLLVRSDRPDFVERLYAAGAVVVMRAPGRSTLHR